jgi:hypothetical protein
MKRGRPFEPGNRFGRGRPPGSRNKKTLVMQRLVDEIHGALDEYGPALVRKALSLAVQGDTRLLCTLLHLLPRPQDSAVKIGRLPMNTLEELIESQGVVMNKVATGQITPTQAQKLDSMLENRRRHIETQDLARRVRALEQVQEQNEPQS